MKRQALKSALIFQPSSDNSFLRVDLASSKQTFQKIISFKNSYYILTEQGDIWQVENNSTSEPNPSNLHLAFLPFPELTKCKIADIVANDTVMFIITRQGFVYSWGEDPNNYGLLGLKDIVSTEKPEKIPELSGITYISVSTKHAAAIDSKGNLFTWGTGSKGELCHTGLQKITFPLMFQSALLLSSKIVVCYQELTGVITTGGHLCLYGEFSKDPSDQIDLVNSNIPKTINHEFTPKSILGIPKMSFITSLSFSDNFAVFLTSIDILEISLTNFEPEKYEIFIITNHYICQKLDFSTKFKTITVKRNSIFGLTEDGRYMVEWEYLKSCESQRTDQAVTFLAGSETKVLQVTQLYETYCKNSAYQQFQEIYNVTLTYESKAPSQVTKEKFDPIMKEKEIKVKLEYINVIGKKATIKCLNYKNPPFPLAESLVSSPSSHRPRNLPYSPGRSPGRSPASSYRSHNNILSLNHFGEEGGYSYKSNVSTPKKLETFLFESKKSPKSAFHSPARSLVLKSGMNSRQPSYTDLRPLSPQASNIDFVGVKADSTLRGLKSQVERSSPQKNIYGTPIKSPSNICSIAATPKAGHSLTPVEFSSMASVEVVVSPSNKKQELIGMLNSLKKANENNTAKEQRLQSLKERTQASYFLSKNNPKVLMTEPNPITSPKVHTEPAEPELEKADFKTRLSKAMEVCKNLNVGNPSKVSSPTHTFKTSQETVYFTANVSEITKTEENQTDKKSSIRERLENLKKARRQNSMQKESISEVENLLTDTAQTVEQNPTEEEEYKQEEQVQATEDEKQTPIFPLAQTLSQSLPSPKLQDVQNFSFKNKTSYLEAQQQDNNQPHQEPIDSNPVNIQLDSPNGKNMQVHEPTPKFSPTRTTFLDDQNKNSQNPAKNKKVSVVDSLLAALSDNDNKFTLNASSFKKQKKKNELKELAELQVTEESQPKSPREEVPLNVLKNLSTQFETIETQINETQANEKKVGTFLSGIGSQDEVKVESVQHLGEIVQLCSLTDPECLKQAEETEKPKQSFQNIDSKKWEVLFTGSESPQGRSLAGSKKSTGKFGGLRAYEELLMKATSLGDHVENLSSAKSENNQNILKEKSIIWMASTIMKKIDHQMYQSFLAIQLHGLKTDNEQVYKLYRFLAIMKSFEREYNHYNKTCSLDMIRKVPSKSLNQMVSKSAFRKLNGVISIWSVIEKNIINTERRVLKLLQKDQDQDLSALNQYKLLENLVVLIEKNEKLNQDATKKEAFEKIMAYVQAKREKYANSAMQLAQALDNYQTNVLLIPTFARIQEYLQQKTTMYVNLMTEKAPVANSHLENFLKKYQQKILQEIYNYSRTCFRKRPKSIQLGFAVILKAFSQRRMKDYFSTLYQNSLPQKTKDNKGPMQNVILKFLVNMLQRKLTENTRDAFAALKAEEESKVLEEADNLKEMNYKLLLLFSALNNIIKQKKSLALNTLRWYLNLKIRTKNQQLAAICFKNLQERVVKRSLNFAFASLHQNQIEQENLSLIEKQKQEEEEDADIIIENNFLDRINSSGTELASSPHFRLPTDQHSDNILNLKEFDDNSPPSDIGRGLSKVIDTSTFSKNPFHVSEKDFRLGARGNKNIYKTSVEDLTNTNNFETPKEYCWNSFPNACQKEEDNQKLQDILNKIEKSRKYYRSLSEALCDKVYRTATQPEPETLQLKPTCSLKYLRLDSQQSNPGSQDKIFPEKEKSMRIFERLKKIALMKQNKRLNNVMGSDSAEIASCQSDSVDLAKIREILNKRKAHNQRMNGPYKRDKNSTPDIQILLHGKGPHNNRPDQVMQLFNYKVPRKDTLNSSVASIDQSSNKLNLSEVLSNKNSRSLIIPSMDSLDKTGSKKSSKQLKKSATVYKKADDSMTSQTSLIDEDSGSHERLPTFSQIPEGTKKYPTPSKTLKSQFSLPIYRKDPVKPQDKRHSGIAQVINMSNFRDTPEPAIPEEEKVDGGKDDSIGYLVRNDSYWSAANSNNEKVVDLKSQKSVDSNENAFSDISSPITPLPKIEEPEIKKTEEPQKELKKDDSLLRLKKVPAKKQPAAPVRETMVAKKTTSSMTSSTSKSSTPAAPARKNSRILVNGQAISPIHKPTATKPKATTKK